MRWELLEGELRIEYDSEKNFLRAGMNVNSSNFNFEVVARPVLVSKQYQYCLLFVDLYPVLFAEVLDVFHGF